MPLNAKIKVELPEKGIIIRRSGKYQYVYKVLSTYRDENGFPTNKRKAIGKLDIGSGLLIPNNSYWELYGDTDFQAELSPSFESIRSVGATFLIGKILENIGVSSILKEVFGAERGARILTASKYMACRGNVFERVLDWCEGFTLREAPICTNTASDLFSSITHAERMVFFKEWIALQPQSGYLAYDVTSFSTYATDIEFAEWGYNRDKEKLRQVNFGCYLRQDNGMPVFYVTYPGSIVDKSHLPYIMAYNEELGIKNVCFVMDRGFSKTDNIKHLHSENYSYVIGVDRGRKEISSEIDKIRNDIVSMRFRIKAGVYATSVLTSFYGKATNIHIYFDPSTSEAQRQNLQRTIENENEKLCKLERLTKKEAKQYRKHFDIKLFENGSFEHKFNYDKMDLAAKHFGFFCILTNTDVDSESALATYRCKDAIEKGFDDMKNHIDMKRLRTHNSDTTDGKMFCAFIALIGVSEITNRLSDFMKENAMSKDGLISELEKIKTVIMPSKKRLMNPITKKQRTIFEACDLTENDLKLYVR